MKEDTFQIRKTSLGTPNGKTIRLGMVFHFILLKCYTLFLSNYIRSILIYYIPIFFFLMMTNTPLPINSKTSPNIKELYWLVAVFGNSFPF